MKNTRTAMAMVCAALVPGVVASTWVFGAGVLVNVAIAVACAAVVEGIALRLRGQSARTGLQDGSAFVTALLLAVALPPYMSPLLIAFAVGAALILGKHVYGGLGTNLFNPAMVGYALLLVSFPADLAAWPNPFDVVDQTTGATALETFKHRGGETVTDVWTTANGFGALGAVGWEWINAAYLTGGLALVALKIVDWRIPAAVLGTLCVLAASTWDGGSSVSLGSPYFHLFSGATMLCAFFIATDPVTCPTRARGRWMFGLFVGAAVFVIRSFANYPDGVAFAVLLGNALTPLLDRLPARRLAAS